MSSGLAKRLKASRRFKCQIAPFIFILERPSKNELRKIRDSATDDADMAMDMILNTVVDWEGVKESDILPGGGGPDVVPFDLELWELWVSDKEEFWSPLSTAIVAELERHSAAVEEAAKN